MGKHTQLYMSCRSTTRYCRPEEVPNPRRFVRCHPLLATSTALDMDPQQFTQVKAAVYVLPKSILPPLSMKISRHSDPTAYYGNRSENSPIHICSSMFFHLLNIFLAKVKSSGICLAEALCDTATPVKKFPSTTDDRNHSSPRTSMKTHLALYELITMPNKPKNNCKIRNQHHSPLKPSNIKQVSVSILFTNNTCHSERAVSCQRTKSEPGNDRACIVWNDLLSFFGTAPSLFSRENLYHLFERNI